MNKFEEKFFNLLVKRFGFYIKDYSGDKKENKWVAISENEEFAYCVIVCKENEAIQCHNEANLELKNIIAKPAMVNVVVIKDNDSLSSQQFNFSNLIYSLKEKRVVYSHEGCKPLIQVLEQMNKQEQIQKNRFKESKLTYALIAINIIIYIISAILSRNIFDIDTYVLVNMGAKVNELINHGQVWRLLTCAFLHGGLLHIAFNMYALKIIGSDVEYAYGRKKYIIIYILSALGGSIFSYTLNEYSISVGASGAVFGLLGAMLVYAYKNRGKIGKGYMNNIVQVIIVNIVIGVTMSNIDNFGHLGGLVFGIIASYICYSNFDFPKTKKEI